MYCSPDALMVDHSTQYEYDVALSFAGEDRPTADDLAERLRAAGVRVFYDRYEAADLWGKDLYQHLQSVYRDRAEFCIVVVSKHYARKVWPRHELKQAQERAFRENREYILPLRVDDCELPGINATVGYIDLRQHPMDDVEQVILQKLFGAEHQHASPDELTWNGDLVPFRGIEVASFWPQRLLDAQKVKEYVVTLPRVPYGSERGTLPIAADQLCRDCAALPGELHVPTCALEECPACHGQALSCKCIQELGPVVGRAGDADPAR